METLQKRGCSGQQGILLKHGEVDLELPEQMAISLIPELAKALSSA